MESNISNSNCNVKSRVHGLSTATSNNVNMEASDAANISTFRLIFVGGNVKSNSNSLLSTNKTNTNINDIWQINVNNNQVASSSNVANKSKHNSNDKNDESTRSMDIFGFSNNAYQ